MRIAALAAAVAVLVCGCTVRAPSKKPIVDGIKCAVTAVYAEDEYHFSVDRTSSDMAQYTLSYPEDLNGLSYTFLNDECTLTYNGLQISLYSAPNGVIDILNTVLANCSELNYDSATLSFTGEYNNLKYHVFTMNDGNLSVISVLEPNISYYFNFNPQ